MKANFCTQIPYSVLKSCNGKIITDKEGREGGRRLIEGKKLYPSVVGRIMAP